MAVRDLNTESACISFHNNALLPMLFGEHDKHLATIEKRLGVSTASRGGVLAITGEPEAVRHTKEVLETLYRKLEKGLEVGNHEIEAAIRMIAKGGDSLPGSSAERREKANVSGDLKIETRKKTIVPYSHIQGEYIRALLSNELVFGVGPAGTGKTYLAMAVAVRMFLSHEVERIILSRPAVEAGEKIGFLPGDLKEKVDPYLRPLYDALYDMIPPEKVQYYIEQGQIEIAPLAFMRGRTLTNAFVILDEAQNSTPAQMKMFLTRLGENSRMAITGDPSQTDLPRGVKSGLTDALDKLGEIDGIGTIRFTDKDVVRHPLAAKIVKAYDDWDRAEEAQGKLL